jgi:hypothetical protein
VGPLPLLFLLHGWQWGRDGLLLLLLLQLLLMLLLLLWLP